METPTANIQHLGIVKDVIMTSLTNLVHHKGFNNMAQAFGMAEDMFMKGMCKDASQGVLMITDLQPSFAYMTNEMVEQLDDKHGTATGPYISKSWVVQQRLNSCMDSFSAFWFINLLASSFVIHWVFVGL